MTERLDPYEYDGITGYSKVQARAIIGCSGLPYITKLITKGRLVVVGEMPINSTSIVTRKLLSVESVEQYAENFQERNPKIHTYQVRLSWAQLENVQAAFPDLAFLDLTESRRIKRDEATE